MLKPATSEDLDFFYELYMHPTVNPYLLYEYMDLDAFIPIFHDLLQKQVLYVFLVDGRPTGMCKIVPQFHRNAHMLYLGGVAIHPAFSGKGFGLMMMQEIIAYARSAKIRRIELSTATTNTVAIRLYERAGFVIEGRLRDYTWYRNEDRYIDEYMMSWIAG